jgi:hypothetical protein
MEGDRGHFPPLDLFSPPRFLKLPVLGEGAISKKIVVFPCFD